MTIVNASEKKFVQYKGENRLSYVEYGNKNGTPILVQHGLIASITDCDLFERLIRTGRRVICMARPGYGESSPYLMKNVAEWGDLVEVLVDKLELPHFDILGMSSGAPYSYAIGYRLPEKVRNIYIFSGIPALYDQRVRSVWPYPVKQDASIAEMAALARELFFSNVTDEDLRKDDIRDSMMNECFGIALDFRIRGMDWGFKLAEVKEKVFMEHSKEDSEESFRAAEITSKLLPDCTFIAREYGGHFSKELLDNFIKNVMKIY